jgi:hypothetical protein
MVSRDDVADDDGTHDLVYVTMLMIPGEWYFWYSRPLPVIPPYLGGSVDIMVVARGIYLHM